MNKRESLSKTLVAEYVVKLADINRVQKMFGDAISIKIDPTSDFVTQQDANINAGSLIITNIKKFILIRSWGSFTVRINGTAEVPCNGSFIVAGSFDKLEILSDTQLRISFVYC